MSTSAAPLPAVRAALAGLIDYAGLFPPAQLDMPSAVAEYARARRGEFAWMLGRFIVPASRVGELRGAIPPNEAPMPLSVILDADWDAQQLADVHERDGALQLQTLEVPIAADEVGATAAALRAAGLEHLPAYVEWPREPDWGRALPSVMANVASAGLGAKIRCGGVVDRAFPSPVTVAEFIATAVKERVRFKATAGLHHPVRHVDGPSGFHMHGFLNLLFASVFAVAGADEKTLRACVSDEEAREFRFDAGGLSWRHLRAATAQIEAARQDAFAGYGSCSFSEPVEDLRGLGLL